MIFASNPNPKKVYLIGGLQVEFPYQPYGSQFAFMARVISTLNLAQKEGHCHTLLESPSGTAIVLLLVSEIPDHTQTEINNKKQKKKEAPTIYYASNAHKVKGHPSLQKGGCNVVRDRRSCKSWTIGCCYYGARSMSNDAQLVFCPYNYINNPVIRAPMEVDIKVGIVILDEAQ
ncbi:Fanconi anemia group J protein [Glycine soja]|uniref:Fanconi anemia group J protein n=1 Tax=Glycine soja TaxID=3848 RepID=A0A0B2RDH3_GLYSO|nr:Fanconi anemia group J protein [Glycine soja]